RGGRPGYPGASPATCSDWNLRINSYPELERLRRQMAQAAPTVAMHGQRWEAVLGCVGWPYRVAYPQHRLAVDRPVPTLVAYGAFNPEQPVAWAESVARQIPGARTLRYAGPGTSTYRSSPCARAVIDTFLVTRSAPTSTTCPAIWP
ncbi:alpha/beta hydrolase, partial [Micromonospora olivasterospora]